ncbi:peptidyl-prolyl cis-trans isomerase D, putative [Marinomonas sp. MED121]|uniref:SurA N-terminal domain-containing protein n=1 Tax=Marinomonas sp. MED121 TaxID=314277 RepID=UPI000069047A|nr:SurA N-terminal domain-containing protein [Marinomonas sp. MED121]EAQ64736.1 peptidyl-prolyl cis-trans isomerase D, putative [Marinomonas sp. MED121]
MLQDIRDKSQGIVVKIIIGFIVVTFALFGVDALVTGFTTSDTVAEVDGVEITRTELLQSAEIQRRQLISMMGGQIDPALLEDTLLQRRALDELIQRAVLTNNANDLNLAVSDAQVDQYLIQAEQFQTDGQFDQTKYLNFIRTLGYTPLAFKQRIKQDILLQQGRIALSSSEFVLSNQVDQVLKLQNQQRSYDYIRYSLADEVALTQVSDTEIQAYFDENTQSFQNPEQVKLDYVIISSVDFHDKVNVSSAELEQAYQAATSTAPKEERRASHILIEANDQRSDEEARALAQDIKSKIDSGTKFEALAKQYSDDLGSKAAGGDLGYVSSGMMVPEFENVLFSMVVDQVSGVVETEFGYHLIELREITNVDTPSLAEMEPELTQEILDRKAQDALLSAQEDITDLAYASDDLNALATEYNVNIMHSDWFGRQGGQELISSNAQAIAAAFSPELLEDSLNSGLLELNEEQVAIVRINEHKPQSNMSLEEASADVQEILLKRKATASLKQKAAQMQADVNNSAWTRVELASRGRDDISEIVFKMARPQGDVATSKVQSLNDGDLVLVNLLEVKDGEVGEDDAQRDYIERYLNQSGVSLAVAAHQKALENAALVER